LVLDGSSEATIDFETNQKVAKQLELDCGSGRARESGDNEKKRSVYLMKGEWAAE
jgi:hypothetical protein